jgi:TRAP-type C4-dicarboxylate transport system substrate-binding protein
MRKHHLYSMTCCFFVLIGVLAAALPTHAEEKVIRLKYANFFPPVHKNSIDAEQWCREVEKRTKGRVKVSYFPGATLVPAPQSYESVVRGVADISMGGPSWTAGRFPLSEVLELPIGFSNCVQATRLANAFYKKFRPAEFDDVKVLYFHNTAPGVFMTVKPIASIDGLRGLRLRAGGNQAKIASAMGATPVSIPFPDIYEGLKRGVIDGALAYTDSLNGWKFADVIRGLQVNEGAAWAGLLFHVMNKEKWNSLPGDIKIIIEQINEEWVQREGNTCDEINSEGKAYGVSMGMNVLRISPEEVKITKERMKPILAEYVGKMKAKGLPGEEALKFCQDYLNTHP